MRKIITLGIDLAKQVFQLHGVDERGKVVLKKKLRRDEFLRFVQSLPVCCVAMEACGGAHYWSREFLKMGHEVKLIAPKFVKPFVKSNKNDAADAEAIVEASLRPSMRFVSVKSEGQQDLQSLHRVRERLVCHRTALMNEIRGLLLEYGFAIPKGRASLEKWMFLLLEDAPSSLSGSIRKTVHDLLEELKELEERIKKYQDRLIEFSKGDEICQRLEKVEGVGVVISTAIRSAIGNAQVFKNGREFSAYLGLVPRQHSSGGKSIVLGISKRGDSYLRGLIIHGCRSVLKTVLQKKQKSSLLDFQDKWILDKLERRGFNKACVALANKKARVIWSLLAHGKEYQRNFKKAA